MFRAPKSVRHIVMLFYGYALSSVYQTYQTVTYDPLINAMDWCEPSLIYISDT